MKRYIQITDGRCGNGWWKDMVRLCAVFGEDFEIHCWDDEQSTIREALRFGREVPSDWQGMRVIRGNISLDLLEFLLRAPKPEQATGYHMMTPFFTIHFGDRLMSDHYGAEMILCDPPKGTEASIRKVLEGIGSMASIHEDP